MEEFASPLPMRVKENTAYTSRLEETTASFVKIPYDLYNFQLESVRRKTEIPLKIINNGNGEQPSGVPV